MTPPKISSFGVAVTLISGENSTLAIFGTFTLKRFALA